MPPPNGPNTSHSSALLIWAPTLLILAPLNIWAAWNFSLKILLQGYFILFASIMNCLAVAILVAGLMLPPVSIAWWVYDRYHEPVIAGL